MDCFVYWPSDASFSVRYSGFGSSSGSATRARDSCRSETSGWPSSTSESLDDVSISVSSFAVQYLSPVTQSYHPRYFVRLNSMSATVAEFLHSSSTLSKQGSESTYVEERMSLGVREARFEPPRDRPPQQARGNWNPVPANRAMNRPETSRSEKTFMLKRPPKLLPLGTQRATRSPTRSELFTTNTDQGFGGLARRNSSLRAVWNGLLAKPRELRHDALPVVRWHKRTPTVRVNSFIARLSGDVKPGLDDEYVQ